MNIAILGSDGFIGSNLCKYFPDAKKFNRHDIDSLSTVFKKKCDIIIDATGNAVKWKAEQNKEFSYENEITNGVLKIHKKFKCNKYILISSIDAIEENGTYGTHKRIKEHLVSGLYQKSNILRCGLVIGHGMKKGIIHDIINNKPLFLTDESEIQISTIDSLCTCVDNIVYKINNADSYSLVHISCSNPISVKELKQLISVEMEKKKKTVKYNFASSCDPKTMVREYLGVL